MSGYAIHPEALLELEEISKYYEQFSESFAAKLGSELYAAFELLAFLETVS
jgi:plasmid stabilization system protein ParE